MIESHSYQTILQQKMGILLVDKPSGVSSHTVVNWARKVFGVRKIGHTGTLDPLASGLLILLVGRDYTKQQERFLKLDKGYLVVGALGVETDTYDSAGSIVKQVSWEELEKFSDAEIIEKITQFSGEMEQTVPAFSAVKRGGKKMYELALKGTLKKDTLPSRKINILKLSNIQIKRNSDEQKISISFEVVCTSGTYIRSLIHDIGKELRVGAHVTTLRRVQIGDQPIKQAEVCPFVPKRFFHL